MSEKAQSVVSKAGSPRPSADRRKVRLGGCAPTPLASYLKALGVLRLVAEQADRDAKGYWENESFVLVSRLDEAELEHFFLEQYRPTPLVAPWGARSGFYPGSSEATARGALDRILACESERLSPFRSVIGDVHSLLKHLGMTEKARDEAKLYLLRACRAELPDYVLPWLDACYVLTEEDRAFPPLLGTGGNEGSGSYVSGFAQQVVACVIDRAHDRALAAALFGLPRPQMGSSQTPGQFAPLAAGGPNATTGFEGRSSLNPWDFLLCLEGTLLFAAAATKRLESSTPGALAFPFTVRAVGAGSGSISLGDERNARAETWFPLWHRPATLSELSGVLAEGRVQVSGRTAEDALDFARAVSALGIQRGIDSFQRYGYLQRFGRNVIAVPLDRVDVRRNPHGDLIDDIDRWLACFRRLARQDVAPARLRSLTARLENTLFDLTRGQHPSRVQVVLTLFGEAQVYLARSKSARAVLPPVPELSEHWARAADDATPEFRIAAGLAGLHAISATEDGKPRAVLPMAVHFAPMDERRHWVQGGDHRATWGAGRLHRNLGALAARRLEAADQMWVRVAPWFARVTVPLAAAAAWLDCRLDERRIAALLPGLALARIPRRLDHIRLDGPPIPAAYAVLKPLFTPRAQLERTRLAPAAEDARGRSSSSRIARSVARLLAANRVNDAVTIGIRRLRAQGMPIGVSLEGAGHPAGEALLSALLIPLSDNDLRLLIDRVARKEDDRHRTGSTIEKEG
jgi:CRISPR-associated protein Csx17